MTNDKPKPKTSVDYKKELHNLLCMIHRDGGHYITAHGIRNAINEAQNRVACLNGLFDTAEYSEVGRPEFEHWFSKLRQAKSRASEGGTAHQP